MNEAALNPCGQSLAGAGVGAFAELVTGLTVVGTKGFVVGAAEEELVILAGVVIFRGEVVGVAVFVVPVIFVALVTVTENINKVPSAFVTLYSEYRNTGT